MKIFIYVLLFLVVTGCASKPPQTDAAVGGSISDSDYSFDLKLQDPTKFGVEFQNGFGSPEGEELRKLSARLLVENPNNVEALNTLSIYYFKKGIYDTSVMLLNKALAAEPASGMTLNNLAVVYFKKGLMRDSLLALAKANEVQLNNREAILNLAVLEELNRNYDKVISLYEQSNKKIFAGEVELNAFAVSYVARNQYAKAEAIYKSVIDKNPKSAKTLLNLAYLKIEKQQDFATGRKLLERLKQVDTGYEANDLVKQLDSKIKPQVKN